MMPSETQRKTCQRKCSRATTRRHASVSFPLRHLGPTARVHVLKVIRLGPLLLLRPLGLLLLLCLRALRPLDVQLLVLGLDLLSALLAAAATTGSVSVSVERMRIYPEGTNR